MDFGHFANGIVQPGTAAFLPAAPLSAVIIGTMQWLLSLIGFFGVIAFVISGIMYLTSAGDEEQATTAKRVAKYALIGIIVALGAVIVLTAITRMLAGDSNF